MGFRPTAPRAGASASSATSAQKWIRHGELRSALPNTTGIRRYLRFAGMKLVEAEGLAPPQPVRAARLQRAAFAALPRLENWGLRRDSHPRPSPYEGAALSCCATEPWWDAPVMLRVLPGKNRRLHC